LEFFLEHAEERSAYPFAGRASIKFGFAFGPKAGFGKKHSRGEIGGFTVANDAMQAQGAETESKYAAHNLEPVTSAPEFFVTSKPSQPSQTFSAIRTRATSRKRSRSSRFSKG
jgi:hypothetical protein